MVYNMYEQSSIQILNQKLSTLSSLRFEGYRIYDQAIENYRTNIVSDAKVLLI